MDKKTEKLLICEPDSVIRNAIEVALTEENLDAYCHINAEEGESLVKPVRIGSFLDRVARYVVHLKEEITFGPYHLPAGTLDLKQKKSNEIIRLTDKEKEILIALKNAPEHTLTRAALLEEVWGYGSNIETHTVETHIYRLRQKIEKDAGKPEFLITNEGGYHLKI